MATLRQQMRDRSSFDDLAVLAKSVWTALLQIVRSAFCLAAVGLHDERGCSAPQEDRRESNIQMGARKGKHDLKRQQQQNRGDRRSTRQTCLPSRHRKKYKRRKSVTDQTPPSSLNSTISSSARRIASKIQYREKL